MLNNKKMRNRGRDIPADVSVSRVWSLKPGGLRNFSAPKPLNP